MAPCDAWLSHLGSLWGHLRSLGGHLGSLGTATGGHLGSLGATCESLWSHFGVTWASNWPQDCITVTISQTHVKHTKSLGNYDFRSQHAQDRVTSGHFGVPAGHLRSLGVTWGHLMALVVPFGVTLGSLALAWRALGVTWDGHLGSLGVTWGD